MAKVELRLFLSSENFTFLVLTKAQGRDCLPEMKTLHLLVGMFSLGTLTTQADVLRLTDGTVLEGELGAPTEIIVNTAAGEKRVPFSLLSPEVQQRYWRKAAEQAALTSAVPQHFAVTADDLSFLGAEVNLDTWEQVAAIGSFRDKPEKRGTGGLVVTKAFNALEENWTSVYSPKDPVGEQRNWDVQVAKARQTPGSD